MKLADCYRAWAAAHRMPDSDLDGFGPPDDDEDDSTEGPEDPDAVYEDDG